ncbi:MAG TPA: secondary thiamine-phosphate synthase enzyme YjbQ [Syntrophales bacterium]|jgi:secondary thiamine-phosphate synthase enzyme|nr:secondary thiamine-phosphate synthase enzyme YjbQ [Syntrophales bacterium]HOU78232.1 secondary thiamine-phosphate synthase enzyme YjbQ [Syntrophales bacterium]HPC33239.1 secondary thiamine-phosphate synthase enzyme YjbQ [Syntrophales bacterium]HQG34521.1 secondary thiamine-phosphate synthase enzyme YjbQ [Syntrophales bacterium]HQI36153.1 secondary thiamine-phosphate synthase enzyme YjbQ [Syntrophales bacterium]
MIFTSFHLSYATSAGTDVIDITGDVAAKVREAEIGEGQALISVPGSTASLTTIEYERGVVRDLIDALERIAPADIPYRHDARWGDGNGYAHVRAALLGPSVVIPVNSGRLVLGTWQQIVLVDFDNRPRQRRIFLQVSGI